MIKSIIIGTVITGIIMGAIIFLVLIGVQWIVIKIRGRKNGDNG